MVHFEMFCLCMPIFCLVLLGDILGQSSNDENRQQVLLAESKDACSNNRYFKKTFEKQWETSTAHRNRQQHGH